MVDLHTTNIFVRSCVFPYFQPVGAFLNNSYISGTAFQNQKPVSGAGSRPGPASPIDASGREAGGAPQRIADGPQSIRGVGEGWFDGRPNMLFFDGIWGGKYFNFGVMNVDVL